MANKKLRTLEVIQASDIVQLHREAELLVPVSYLTLLRRGMEGRLELFGKPHAVDRVHLISQFRAGFPKVDGSDMENTFAKVG